MIALLKAQIPQDPPLPEIPPAQEPPAAPDEDPAPAHPRATFLVLGAIGQAASVLYLSVLNFGGTRLADVFRRRRGLTAGATSVVGAAFIAFAVKLSVASA